jgi:di/tricarboxylate transporter
MEPYLVIGLLACALALFASEKISVDLVTLGLLSTLVLTGVISVEEAFAGYGREVIVMLGSIFVVGAALRETGVLDTLGHLLARASGGSIGRLKTGLLFGVGGISAFMNNTTVVAMFLGPVIGLARRLNLSPSHLLMPLAYASILGGTCTLIGTSTNVAVSGAFKDAKLGEVGMFETARVGVPVCLVGFAYLLLFGRRLIPVRDRTGEEEGGTNFREYFSEVVILPESPMIGQEVFKSDFSVLGFMVLQLMRRNEEIDVGAHTRFEEGDIVRVAGKVENLIRIKKIEGLDILEDVSLRNSGVDMSGASVAEVVLTPRSGLVGRTLRSSNFRRRSGLSVLALRRGDQSIRDHLGDVTLEAGDLLLVQGPLDRLRGFEENSEMVVIGEHAFTPGARKRGIALLAGFVLAVTASSCGLLPPAIAFLLVALLALATRCLTLEAAYENIDWRLLILIGGMTAFGTAMAKSGAARMLADLLTGQLAALGPQAVLAGFCVLTVFLTQGLSNAAAALVVLPIALESAASLEVDPRSFGMGIMLSASISVLTPFEPSCILVYGPGKYRFADFIKVGSGLVACSLVLIVTLVPVFWPLR